MRLLLVNPNITTAITGVMASEARRSAGPATTILPVTARFGTQYIANRAEAAIAAHAVLEAIAEHAQDCDGAIIAAFGDPGLAAARELFDIPVTGLTEAALLTAWPLGRRHAIVCLTPRLRRWYQEAAQEHGLDGRLVAVRALEGPIPDITQARELLRDRIAATCRQAVEEDDAEVIILGGGPIAGLAREIADDLPVPVLDGVSCAVRQAETLVALAPRPPTRGSFARPEAKPAQGLSPALLRRITGQDP